MEVVAGVSSIITLVEVAGKIGSLCAKYISDVRDAKSDAERIMKEAQILSGLLNEVEGILNGPFGVKLKASQALKDALQESKKVLENLESDLERGLREDEKPKKTNFLKKMAKGLKSEALKWPFKKKDVEEIVENLRALKTTVSLALQIDNVSIVALKDLKMNLEKLPVVREAIFGSLEDQHEPQCLPQTRTEVLKGIEEWAAGPRDRCIFWLRGMAGTGKSTIARTVARYLEDNSQLGASFFFKRSQAQRSNASKFFPTLAYSLTQHIPSLVPHMNAAIEGNPDVSGRNFKEQFEKLIFEPLSRVGPTATVVIVIDALDECENENEIPLILGFLGQLSKLDSVDLRIFVTSRPEFAPQTGFRKLSKDNTYYHDLALHDVERETVKRDICVFLKHEFARIQSDHYDELSESWPGEEAIQQLVRIAEPLFISAATICRFVDDKYFPPQERLGTLLASQKAPYGTPGVYQIYLTIIEQLLSNLADMSPDDKETVLEQTRKIISTIVVLESPLSRRSLSELIGIAEETIRYRLKTFHSILRIPVDPDLPIKTFHLSFRDFLLYPGQKSRNTLSVNEPEVHRRIAGECITLLSRRLRENICSLKSSRILRSEIDSGTIRQHLPADLEYACRYWVHHLKKSQHRIEDGGSVHTFLQEHLLHWLEATSLLGYITETLNAVDALTSIIDTENGKSISEFILDVKRFVLQNQYIIDRAPLQTYFSAIIFLPERSIVRNIFNPEKMIKWVYKLPRVKDGWDALLQTLVGHTDSVGAVAFSPDGKVLASASYDETIRLWDAGTGAPLQTLEGHTGWVLDVAFSPDGKLLASASADYTVRLWDAGNGTPLQTLEGHTSSVFEVAFSPDGKALASASRDNTVRLWDAGTGAPLQTLGGHTHLVTAVAFSPDSKALASASDDDTVRLWDAGTGAPLQTLEGHAGWVADVAFSPDGKLLASASGDHTVRLWDAGNGTPLQTLEGHTSSVFDVAFSPDGKALASASRDYTVRLWGAGTGAPLQTLKGHIDSVRAVAFSPDSKTLASISDDKTVRLWDAGTGAPLQTLEGHTDLVSAVAFSPDGKVLASASDDDTVRLWDAGTGPPLQSLEGHTDLVGTVTFSPDGKLLASASYDETIRLWDAGTGAPLQTLEGHTDSVSAVAFSPDGKLLASASGDHTVRLWDAGNGTPLQTLKGHIDSVRAVAFSPDGKLLVSASRDNTVRLWDAGTGAPLQTLEGHTGWVTDVAFSPDGKVLASASDDETIRLWDAGTGAPLQTLEEHTHSVSAVAFSPNGKVLASASYDETIRLWDAGTGAPLQTLEGHTDSVSAVAFSPDGKVLASASDDDTVRLWDAGTGPPLQIFATDGGTTRLSFSKDGRYVNTDRHSFSCQSNMALPVPVVVDQHRITLEKEWLTRGKGRFIWLPHSHRASCSAIHDDLIALGHYSGGVSFIGFKFDL